MMTTCIRFKDVYIGYDDKYHREREAAMTDNEWQERAKGILKAELKRRNVSYRDLAERLEAMGIEESDRNIANKISRGGFTAVFFLQCMEAIGARTIRLSE